MSIKLKPYKKLRRYTKKTPQFGGSGSIKYAVTGKGEFIEGLTQFLAKDSSGQKKDPTGTKTVKVTIPKDNKDQLKEALNEAKYDFKETGMPGCRNCDREVTTPLNEKFSDQKYENINLKVVSVLSAVLDVEIDPAQKKNFEEYARKNKLDVKILTGIVSSHSVVAKRSITSDDLTGINESTKLNAVSFGMKVEASRSKTEEEVTKLIEGNNPSLKVICKKVGMMCGPNNCDYDVTFYGLPATSDVPVVPGGVTLKSMRVNFQVSTDDQLRKLKYHISKQNKTKPGFEFELIDSNGKTVKLEDEESEKLIDTYGKNTAITSKYIISFQSTNEPDYDRYVNDIREKLETKDPNVVVEKDNNSIAVITSLSQNDVNAAANEVTNKKVESIVKADPTPPSFDDLVKKGLSSSEQEFKYDENEFEKVYAELVDNNPKMKTSDGTLIIKKPTELKDKMVLFNLLMSIKALVRGTREGFPDALELQRIKVKNLQDEKQTDLQEEQKLSDMENASLLTQRIYVATFFTSVNELRQKAKGDLTPDVLKDTPAANFFKRLYDIDKPVGWLQGKLNHAARVIPIIAAIRNYYKGLNTISFDSKMIGEEALQQQRRDIARGIENEFAIWSAFIGTKSQKVAVKTGLIAAAASGLWGLYATIQKNPETAAMLATVVAGCGPQAIAAAGILALAVASYYVYLKIQDKYAKYFILIRTMNEFMIVLNKIERLVRLSMNISRHYQFNVNLKDIEAQLKILFDRFNKMLSEDDVSQIEQTMKGKTTLPDFGAAAADAESIAEQAAAKALQEDAKSNETKKKDQGGGGFGDFIFRVTFDVELWNQKLNDDVVKLNLHFTTAMAEFSMVLNVIQIDLLTSENPIKRKVIKTANDAVTASTEYRKMIIGILLNDILKLRVDYSYCNRGGYLTNTKSEGVCTDIENLDIDPVGNKRSKFKEKLHGLIKHLAEILNKPTCPYPPDVKNRIKKAVIEPYVQMIRDANPELGKGNKFYLTDGATLSTEDIEKAKTDAINALQLGDLTPPTPPPTQKGGQWYKFNKAVDTKPSLERDVTILQELKTRAYDFVSHNALMQFLMGVDKFVKAEGEPTTAEKKEAQDVAKEIVEDAKISQVVTSDLAEAQKKENKEQLEREAQQKQSEEQSTETDNSPLITDVGGRRLTRKRIFKPKKNRRVSRTHDHFKSAADALKAFRRK
jgi:hypothetical protein